MSRKRILCVEDHADTIDLISFILKKYKIVSAFSLGDALRLSTLEKFDLYLLDYHLPDGTGLELALLIKNYDKETPILFVTGSSSISESQAKKIGAEGVIKKGSKNFVSELEDRVVQLLEQQAI